MYYIVAIKCLNWQKVDLYGGDYEYMAYSKNTLLWSSIDEKNAHRCYTKKHAKRFMKYCKKDYKRLDYQTDKFKIVKREVPLSFWKKSKLIWKLSRLIKELKRILK